MQEARLDEDPRSVCVALGGSKVLEAFKGCGRERLQEPRAQGCLVTRARAGRPQRPLAFRPRAAILD